MPADLKEPFGPSCCDGGACGLDDKSAMPCGCDKGAGWVCERHREDVMKDTVPAMEMVEHVGIPEYENFATCPPKDGYRGIPRTSLYSNDDNARIPDGFVIKDSGKREQYTSGMQRDTADGKIDYTLVRRGPMFERWAEHLRKGAIKYGKNNWLHGNGQAELDRAHDSAARHFEQWLRGDEDEDHAAAVYFNINLAEYVKDKMKRPT